MKIDGRKLDHATLEHIRIRACERYLSGESANAIMDSLGMCRTSIYDWLKAYRKKGKKGLKSSKAQGPERRLEISQQKQLRDWILKQDPRDFGFLEALWSRRIISELIKSKFRHSMSLSGVGKLLKHLGITPQKPLRRAYERDSKKIEQWKKVELPKICKRAKRKNAKILFLDEAGIRSDSPLSRTWGAKGKTPIVKTSGQRQKVNAISAVSPKGEFRFDVFTGRFNASYFVEVLKRFTRGSRQPSFFIVDGHPAHRAKIVKEFVASTKGRIEIYFLPPYAPDLNPDEFVWNHLKNHGISKKPLRKNQSLKERIKNDLLNIKKQPKLIKSFFKAKSVGYPSL